MKKILTLIFVLSAIIVNSQTTPYSTQQTDINFYVNDSRPSGSLTGTLMNSFMNRLLENPSGMYHDATRPYYEDSSLIINSGAIFIANTDVTGGFVAGNFDRLIGYDGTDNVLSGGTGAGINNTSGTSSVYFGFEAGNTMTTGVGNVHIGHQAGKASNASNCIFIGKNAGDASTGLTNMYIGTNAGGANTGGLDNCVIGHSAMTEAGTATSNLIIGNSAGRSVKTTNGNTVIGRAACGANVSLGAQNVILGDQAAYNTTSGSNIIIGYQANYSGNSLGNCVIIGHQAGYNNDEAESVMIGYKAGNANTSGSNQTFLGTQAGELVTTGINNTLLGYQAGQDITTGQGNVFIGYQSKGLGNVSNKLFINNGSGTSPLVYGDFNTDSIGINGDLIVKDLFAVQGEDTLASAATATLDSMNITITGTADIDSIDSASSIPNMGVVYIFFTGTAASNGVVDGKNIEIEGNFAYTPNDMLVLQRRQNIFYQVSRSPN